MSISSCRRLHSCWSLSCHAQISAAVKTTVRLYSRHSLSDSRWMMGVSSVQMMFYVSVDGTVILALYALITGTLFVDLPLKGVLAVIGATLMIAIFGSLFFALGIRSTDAQTAAIASTLEPITSLAAGAIFLGETVGVRSLIGALLILAAVVLVSIAEKKTA